MQNRRFAATWAFRLAGRDLRWLINSRALLAPAQEARRVPARRTFSFFLFLRHACDEPLLHPHAGLVAVGELDAGFFQGVLDGLDGARFQRLACFKARDGSRRDLGHGRKVTDPKAERGARHSALSGIDHSVLFLYWRYNSGALN